MDSGPLAAKREEGDKKMVAGMPINSSKQSL
jgi:hypothetical protein